MIYQYKDITDEATKEWVAKQVELLTSGNNIVVNGRTVLDLQTFWTEVTIDLETADGQDDQFSFIQGRLNGYISEAQQAKDKEIILDTTYRLLAPYELEAIEEQRLNDLEDAAISAWDWHKDAMGF